MNREIHAVADRARRHCVEFTVICTRFTSAALYLLPVDGDAYITSSSLP